MVVVGVVIVVVGRRSIAVQGVRGMRVVLVCGRGYRRVVGGVWQICGSLVGVRMGMSMGSMAVIMAVSMAVSMATIMVVVMFRVRMCMRMCMHASSGSFRLQRFRRVCLGVTRRATRGGV